MAGVSAWPRGTVFHFHGSREGMAGLTAGTQRSQVFLKTPQQSAGQFDKGFFQEYLKAQKDNGKEGKKRSACNHCTTIHLHARAQPHNCTQFPSLFAVAVV